MKYIIPYMMYVLLSINSLEEIKKELSLTEIEWSEHKELTWLDFQASPDDESDFHALTSTYLEVERGCTEYGEFKYNVKAVFIRDASWVTDKRSQELLEHERLHFDLTEFYARKMRKYFNDLVDPCNMPVEYVTEKVESIYNDLEIAHKMYDESTHHGLNKENQAMWVGIVERSLAELEAFKSVNP